MSNENRQKMSLIVGYYVNNEINSVDSVIICIRWRYEAGVLNEINGVTVKI